MAILRDVEVTVSANGKKLQEYDDDAEEPSPSNTATRYIEALTGARFQVHFNVKQTLQLISSDIKVLINIDGAHMDSRTLLRGQHLTELSREPYSNSISGARRFEDPGWTFQQFRFAEIKTCEDSLAASDTDFKKLVSGLGIIRVEFHKVEVVGSRDAPTIGHAKPRALDALPEKALKGQALSHRASLGPQHTVAPWRVLKVRRVDGAKSPFAIFNFKYRSRESLQRTFVIPRTPSPVPLEQRPIDNLTREEALELLRRRWAPVKPEVTPAIKSLKREHEDFDPRRNEDGEYVALLASARAQKVPRIKEPVGVIDLLDD